MDQPPPIQEPQAVPRPSAMSLPARLLNIFAVPGEVFDDVKAAPNAVGNWLVPMILLATVMALTAVVMFSQPAIKQQLREQQIKAFDAQVKAGKVKQEQVDMILGSMEKFMIPMGVIGGVFASAARIFWWGFVVWLLGRLFLKASFGYAKALEIAGLGGMVAVLGGIVTLLLIVNLARMFASPSLALVVTDFDATRKSHLFLGAANVFSFWLVGIMSLGLSRLSGAPFLRAAFLVTAYWVLQESLFIMSGMGQFAL